LFWRSRDERAHNFEPLVRIVEGLGNVSRPAIGASRVDIRDRKTSLEHDIFRIGADYIHLNLKILLTVLGGMPVFSEIVVYARKGYFFALGDV